MRSMTGFGCGEAELDGHRLTCELRALNHRFLDVRVRMPEDLTAHAFFVEQLAREQLARGRFDVGVRYDDNGLAPRFSAARARAVYQALLSLRDRPEAEKAGWRELFDYYVFGSATRAGAHLPEAARGPLGPLDEMTARRLRATLLNRLNR